MFTKNVFTKTDAVADLIKGINEADYKAKMEALKGDQHEIDKNKNGKVDAHDFKILRGEKKVNKDQVEEGNNPFDVKNYKSQLPTKPGEKAGFDSKKVSTGTVYTKKPVKDTPTPMKNEEVEDLDEAKFDPLKHIKNPNPAVKAAAKDVKRSSYAQRTALMKAGGVKDDRGPRGVTQEESEQIDELNKDTLYSYAQKANNDMSKKHKELAMQVRGNKPVEANKTSAKLSNRDKGLDRAEKRLNKEEAEQMDERTLSKGETAEKERIVKGMKKSLAGFKARYGDKAKSVMYATATARAKK